MESSWDLEEVDSSCRLEITNEFPIGLMMTGRACIGVRFVLWVCVSS